MGAEDDGELDGCRAVLLAASATVTERFAPLRKWWRA